MPDDSVELRTMRPHVDDHDHDDRDDLFEANEPLIAAQSSEPPPSAPPIPHASTPATKSLYHLTASACLSGLLFGYDTGVVSATLVSIGADLSGRALTTADKSLITAVTALLALLSAPATGWVADRYGRRVVLLCANVLFIVGAVVQAAAAGVGMMVVGRGFVGAAVGLASAATPLYISELAPAEMRGRMVTVQSLFITGGQVLAYVMGYLLAGTGGGWRWMVGLGAVPAGVQFGLLWIMVESPRWLVRAGHMRRARAVLEKMYGGLDERARENTVDSVLACIEFEITEETNKLDDDASPADRSSLQYSTLNALLKVASNRRALSLACMLQALQQLCGFNSLMYFSATIFALAGFASPIATSLVIAGTNFLLTLAAFTYIDSVGRRAMLLRSIPVMVVGLLTCAFAFSFIHILQSGAHQADSWDMMHAKESLWPMVLLAAMIVYVASYAIGLGCVPWQQSELFPLRVRSLGSGVATATNWSSNFLVGISFLPMMEVIGPSATFTSYAIVCLAGWIGIWKLYPETAGLELEGIGELLKGGWGVKKSVRIFSDRKAAEEAKLSPWNRNIGA